MVIWECLKQLLLGLSCEILPITDVDRVPLKEETAFPLKDKTHIPGVSVTRVMLLSIAS